MVVMKKGKGSRRPLNKNQQMMMMQGEGPIWDKIKSVASKANDFLKKTKILSTVAGLVPPSTPYVGAIAQPVSMGLRSLGYGAQSGGMAIKSSPIPVMNSMDGPIVGLTSGQAGRGKKMKGGKKVIKV